MSQRTAPASRNRGFRRRNARNNKNEIEGTSQAPRSDAQQWHADRCLTAHMMDRLQNASWYIERRVPQHHHLRRGKVWRRCRCEMFSSPRPSRRRLPNDERRGHPRRKMETSVLSFSTRSSLSSYYSRWNHHLTFSRRPAWQSVCRHAANMLFFFLYSPSLFFNDTILINTDHRISG